MDGKYVDGIIDELLELAEEVMEERRMVPFVAMVVKEGVVVSRGYNYNRESNDISMFSEVAAVRWAQEALETGDLSGYTLVNLFEPTVLGFDVAMWAGIRDFVWCIDKAKRPVHYGAIGYGINDYVQNNPGKISVCGGVRWQEAMELVKTAEKREYYPGSDSMQLVMKK